MIDYVISLSILSILNFSTHTLKYGNFRRTEFGCLIVETTASSCYDSV